MKKIIFLIFLIYCNISNGQVNLIPNPSFELYDTCPNVHPYGLGLLNWYNPTDNTPDYYNSCASNLVPYHIFGGGGVQYAKSGNGYFGAAQLGLSTIDQKEYLQVALTDSLKKDSLYYLRFYVSLHNNMGVAVNDIEIYFSSNAEYYSTLYTMPVIPQLKIHSANCLKDTLNWMLVDTIFKANGGEKFLTIGNFETYTNTDTCKTGHGTWTESAYYYFDDFYLGRVSDTTGVIEQENEILFRIYPNPSSGLVYLNINTTDNENLSIKLYDLCSKVLHNERLQQGKASYTFDFSHLSKGIYCFTLFKNNKPVSSQRLVINR